VSSDDVRRLVERYRDGWFDHDVEAIMSVVSDDVVVHNVLTGERIDGAAALRAFVAATGDRLPDLSLVEHALYVAGDTGVSEWTARATTADGRRVEWDGVDVINCRDGRVVRDAVYSGGHAPRVVE
jgi:taurine dehydrogenase small subunit